MVDLGRYSKSGVCSQAFFDTNIVSVTLVIHERFKLSDWPKVYSYQQG